MAATHFIVKRSDSCPASKPWGVFSETAQGSGISKGSPHGCFTSKAAARQQQSAIYASIKQQNAAGEPPPHLRNATEGSDESCSTCEMFFGYIEDQGFGFCSGFSNVQVRPDQVCDDYSPEPAAEEAKSGSEVPMSVTASPTLAQNTIEWRVARASKLSENQRKRTETRQSHAPLELRDESDDGHRVLRSYASLFNDSYPVRAAGHRFAEVVRPGAFKRTLGTNPDVVFRTEHSGPPLAATWSGDLRLGEDDLGLWYEVDLDTSDPDVQSLISKVNRGVYRESSFAFRVPSGGDKWNEARDVREVTACELDRGDVSVVTFGASRRTGDHMLMRSEEEAVHALQEIGFERLIEAFKEWRDFTLLPREERIGKVISSQSMESLRQVLGLIANADDAVDEAEAMLSDFLGVPNPDEETETKGDVTSSEQLDHTGRTEERDDPNGEDYGIMYGLKDVKMAIAAVIACQLCDPGNGSDPDDEAVMSALNQLNADVDAAIVAQAQDKSYDDDEQNAATEDFWTRGSDLSAQLGWHMYRIEDGAPLGPETSEGEERAPLTTKARNSLPATAFVFPKQRRYPIQNIAHARNALARSSGKPEEAQVKRAVYAKYPSLKPSSGSSRSEALLPNDTEDLRDSLRLRSVS